MTRFSGITLAAIVLVATGCSEHRGKDQRQIVVPHVPGQAIEVKSQNGSIEVRADRSVTDVIIDATILAAGNSKEEGLQRARDTKIHAVRNPNGVLSIYGEFPGKLGASDGIKFIIRLPDARGTKLETTNGSLRIQGLHGTAKMKSTNGSIKIGSHRGHVDAVTSNGSITASDMDGSIRARSSNGSVRVKLALQATGPIDADTSNGSINVSMGRAYRGELSLSTTNGRVKLDDQSGAVTADLQKTRGLVRFPTSGTASTLQTSNGHVHVTVK